MLNGIIPVLPTPFRSDGQIDEAALRNLVKFALRCKVAGIVFPGFASEVEFLSTEERQELCLVVADEIAGRVPMVLGASADSAATVIGYGKFAAGLGVNNLMVQTPPGIDGGDQAAVAFLKEIDDALDDVQIMLQNAPAPRGPNLSCKTILQILDSIPGVRYVKEESLPSGPTITSLLESCNPNLIGIIGGGGARYFMDEYSRGVRGMMPALELADVHVAMDRHFRLGNPERTRELYVRTLPLLLVQAVYRMRLTKYVLMRRGVLDNAVVRAPLPEMDSRAIADVDGWLDSIADILDTGLL